MKVMDERISRQAVCIEKWKNNNYVGALDACPRFGKTYVGLRAIDEIKNILNTTPKVLIITPSEIIKHQWEKLTVDYDNITILTTQLAINQLNELMYKTWDLFIVDELHRYSTPDSRNMIIQVAQMSASRLGLSGTYPYKDREIKKWFPVFDVITEQEAAEKGWISDYIEYNIPVELDESDKIRYTNYSTFITETLELFKDKARYMNGSIQLVEDDYDLIRACYVGAKVRYENITYIPSEVFRNAVASIMGWNKNLDLSIPSNRELDIYWNPNNIYERCKQFTSYVSKRNEILINNNNKLNMVLSIIKANPVPTIIFNESIDFVERIADALGCEAIAYHSKIKSRFIYDEHGNKVCFSTGRPKIFGATKLKEEAIQGIKSGKYKYLITAKSLDEGLDLPELRQVIITAGSTNPISQIQRVGRVKTTDNKDLNKIAHIFNIYVEDFVNGIGDKVKSRDKSKLFSRQRNYTYSVKWLNDLSDFVV
ncbi:hypothetical protein DSECCO2_120540 [anaerobic digester metagenome]